MDDKFMLRENCHDCDELVSYCTNCQCYYHSDGETECFLHHAKCRCKGGKNEQ